MKNIWIIILTLFVFRLSAIELIFTDAIIQGSKSTIVPFKYYQSLIILNVKIQDQEGSFILDTGANGLVLNSKYFEADRLSSNSAYGLNGEISEVGRSKVREMMIDEIMFSNISAENIDLREIEEKKKLKILGLIGYNVIKDYEVMLNYRERYVTFSKLDKRGHIIEILDHTREKLDSFDFDIANFIPVIEVSINGKMKRMGIDTGAEINVIDNRRNRNILENFKVINRINIAGADGRSRQAIAGILFRVKLGNDYRCASMATMMTNMDSLNEIYGSTLDGIFGHSFLAPWIFSINYKKKRIYIHRIKYSRT
ncbi:aspartyl protease family protein [Portibacter marinus]|uniref:aspartyl protease family protein n=1 Tax=Portibacter marinus TaxID=2898660 RepID=UPI001F163AE8|nr:aspartyl protease family protein [Portibacter marinus]